MIYCSTVAPPLEGIERPLYVVYVLEFEKYSEPH